MLQAINSFIENLANKLAIKSHISNIYRNSFLIDIKDFVINKAKHRYIPANSKIINVYNYNHSSLEELHKYFVITPIDNAASNFAFTCKKLYIHLLQKEIEQAIIEDGTH